MAFNNKPLRLLYVKGHKHENFAPSFLHHQSLYRKATYSLEEEKKLRLLLSFDAFKQCCGSGSGTFLGQAGSGAGIIVHDLDQDLTFSLTTRKSVPDNFSKFSNFYSKWFDYGKFVHLKLADCVVGLF